MTLELHHIYIKRELIRAFALADEWIDYAIDFQLRNATHAENTISYISLLLRENELIFSSIKEYRFCEGSPRPLRDDFNKSKFEHIDSLLSGALSGDSNEIEDTYALREKLRGQLLECLSLLDLTDEVKSCRVTLALLENMEIDVMELVAFVTNRMKVGIDHLDMQKKPA